MYVIKAVILLQSLNKVYVMFPSGYILPETNEQQLYFPTVPGIYIREV